MLKDKAQAKSFQKVYPVGAISLSTPECSLLPSVTIYKEIAADATENECITLSSAERLLVVGTMIEGAERLKAEARFKALKEGHNPPEREVSTPLYRKLCKHTLPNMTMQKERIFNMLVPCIVERYENPVYSAATP